MCRSSHLSPICQANLLKRPVHLSKIDVPAFYHGNESSFSGCASIESLKGEKHSIYPQFFSSKFSSMALHLRVTFSKYFYTSKEIDMDETSPLGKYFKSFYPLFMHLNINRR